MSDEIRYRYEDGSFWKNGEPDVYHVIKRTPKGERVDAPPDTYCGHKTPRFIPDSSRKKFAWATKGEALVSYQARKRYQIEKLEHLLDTARQCLEQSAIYLTPKDHGRTEQSE